MVPDPHHRFFRMVPYCGCLCVAPADARRFRRIAKLVRRAREAKHLWVRSRPRPHAGTIQAAVPADASPLQPVIALPGPPESAQSGPDASPSPNAPFGDAGDPHVVAGSDEPGDPVAERPSDAEPMAIDAAQPKPPEAATTRWLRWPLRWPRWR